MKRAIRSMGLGWLLFAGAAAFLAPAAYSQDRCIQTGCNCPGGVRYGSCSQTCAQICGGGAGGYSQAQIDQMNENNRAMFRGKCVVTLFRGVKESPSKA